MIPIPMIKCKAHNNRGEPCAAYPIRGALVCSVHGGRAPQVKRSAQQRLSEMVDPALTALAELVDAADSDAIKLAAIKDVLDRAGYKPKERVEQTGSLVVEVVYSNADPRVPEAPALGSGSDQE